MIISSRHLSGLAGMVHGLSVLAVTLSVSVASGQDVDRMPAGKVDLRPKFERGVNSRLVMKIKDNSTTTAGGEKSQRDMNQEITLLERVIDTDPEKGSTVELVYERLKVNIVSDALGDFDFDSGPPAGSPASTPSVPGVPGSDPAPKPSKPKPRDGLDVLPDMLTPSLKEAVGTTLTLKIDPNGNITSVAGGEKLAMAGALGGIGLSLPADAKSLGSLFGPISSGKQGGSPGLVSVGEKWSSTDTFPLGPFGNLRMKTDHTLRAAMGDQAEIVFSGRLEEDTSTGGGASPVKIRNSAYRGKYTWDTRKGRLKNMDSEMETVMEAAGSTVNSKTTTTVERKIGGIMDRKLPGTDMPERPTDTSKPFDPKKVK